MSSTLVEIIRKATSRVRVVARGAGRPGGDQHRVARAERQHVVAELDRELAVEHEVDLLDRAVAVPAGGIAAGRHVRHARLEHAHVDGELLGLHRARVAEEGTGVLAGVVGRVGRAQDRVVAHAFFLVLLRRRAGVEAASSTFRRSCSRGGGDGEASSADARLETSFVEPATADPRARTAARRARRWEAASRWSSRSTASSMPSIRCETDRRRRVRRSMSAAEGMLSAPIAASCACDGALARFERAGDRRVHERVLEQLLRELAQRVLALAGDAGPAARSGRSHLPSWFLLGRRSCNRNLAFRTSARLPY